MFMRAVAMRVCNGVTFDANIGLWGSMALSVSGTINGTTIIRDRGFWMDAVAAPRPRAARRVMSYCDYRYCTVRTVL